MKEIENETSKAAIQEELQKVRKKLVKAEERRDFLWDKGHEIKKL